MHMKKLVIDGKLPNLNDYTKACRSNRYAGAKMKEEAELIVTAYIMQQLKGIHYETVKLDFRWYESNRKRDLDNICFAKKFILDALVKNGTIKTDSWKGVVGFTDSFFVDSRHPRIEVDIKEVSVAGTKDGDLDE